MSVSDEGGYQPLRSVSEWGAPDVSPAWQEFAAALDGARRAATDDDVARALDFALRSAALETGAIEGLYQTSRGITRTVALQGAMWEAALDEIGPDVRGHFAAQLEALELVLDVATQARPVTEVWIRELHALTCREQKTYRVLTDVGWQNHELRHGTYKRHANHVRTASGVTHFYCPPDEVAVEMGRFVGELASPAFHSWHPAVQAAYAHHAFVAIHPFADGNGRVARALASVYLYRGAGVPLVIFSDQQERYWDALHAADSGQYDLWVRFVEDRAMDAMAMITNRLREAAQPVGSRGDVIRALFEAHQGLTYAEIEACGQRITSELQLMMIDNANEGVPSDLRGWIEPRHDRLTCDFGRPYHTLQRGGAFKYAFACDEPVSVQAETTPIVGVSDSKDERFAFIVIDANRPGLPPLLLRVDDVHPAIAAAAELRMRSWVAAACDAALADIQRGIEQGLRSRGFAP